MSLFKEDIDHAADRLIDVADGALNKSRNIGHEFLDRVSGAKLNLFGCEILRLEIPPRQAPGSQLPASAA